MEKAILNRDMSVADKQILLHIFEVVEHEGGESGRILFENIPRLLNDEVLKQKYTVTDVLVMNQVLKLRSELKLDYDKLEQLTLDYFDQFFKIALDVYNKDFPRD